MKGEASWKHSQNSGSSKGLLANAGQMTLHSSGGKSYSSNRLMQEIIDNDEFKPLTNVTTTFIDKQGNLVNPPISKISNNNNAATDSQLQIESSNRFSSS